MLEDARGQPLVQLWSGSCSAQWCSQTCKCVTVTCGCVVKCWLPGWEAESLWEEVPGCSGVPASVEDTLAVSGHCSRPAGAGIPVLQASVPAFPPLPSLGAYFCTLVFFPLSVFHFHSNSVFDTLVSRAAGPSHTQRSDSQRTAEPDRRHT